MPRIQLGKPNLGTPIIFSGMTMCAIYMFKPWQSGANAGIDAFFLAWLSVISIAAFLYETDGTVDETVLRFRRPWGWSMVQWTDVSSVSRDPHRTDLILFTLKKGNRWTGKVRFEEGIFLRDPVATDAGIDKEMLILMCNRRCGAA